MYKITNLPVKTDFRLIHRLRVRWAEVVLHAQAGAVRFYGRHGFQAHGEPFAEAGLAHQTMVLAL